MAIDLWRTQRAYLALYILTQVCITPKACSGRNGWKTDVRVFGLSNENDSCDSHLRIFCPMVRQRIERRARR